ncbi:MAG: hypothetical protein SOI66_07385 [Bifidobacterium sp.]
MENNNFRKSVLTFVTTNECSARCKHCLMLSGPKRHEKLEFPFIKQSLIKKQYHLGKNSSFSQGVNPLVSKMISMMP